MKMLLRTRARVIVNQSIQRPSEPGVALPPVVVRRGLRLSIVEGSLSNIHVTVCAGAFLTGFALMLGAGDFELGLIAALPFLGQLFQFVGAYLEERLGERRRMTVISCGVSLIGTNPAPTERQPAHEVRGGGCPLLFGLRCRSPRSPPMPGLTARHLPRFSVIVKRSSALSVLRGSSSCEHAVGPRRYSKSRRVVVGVVECRDL